MSDDDAHDVGYGLLMPYICCTDLGGPYDPASFVAGVRYASVEAALKLLRVLGEPSFARYVEPALLPQLDLLAMQQGWSMVSEPWAEFPDDWTLVTFTMGEEPA